jgi:TP901 family phage tail tape measure protein
MARLKAAATEMGAATTFNASQAANAMETLSRAGLNTEQTLQALPEVLALARGNSIELAEAAGLVTQSIQGMGAEFDQSGRYADVLTRAAQRANTSVVGLGQALSYAAPTARALGLDVEQTAALVGKLADAGIDASRAGTALNSIFSQFQNPASKFRGELDALGITTNDFGAALEQLESSGGKGQAAINAVGQEAGPALRSLLAQGTDSLRELEAELRNAGGAAQQAADTMDDTLPGALERLSSAWRTLQRSIGDNVLGPAKKAVDELADGIRQFVEDGGAEELGRQFGEVFTKITDQAREFMKTFDFKGAMDKAASALETFGEKAENTGRALELTGTVISTVWNGVGFLVGGAMATIAKGLSLVGFGASGAIQILNKLGIVSDDFAAKASMHANALNASADAMMNYSVGALTQVGQNLGVVAEETEKATVATKAQTKAAQDAAVANNFWAWAAKNTAEAQAEVGAEAAKTARETESQTENVRKLKARYDELKASGTASVQELGAALVALNQAQDAAVKSSSRLEAAYRTLGVTSQAELRQAAETAKTSFQAIQESGTASALDIESAFKAYAKAAQESGDEAIITTAAMAGAAAGVVEDMGAAADSVAEVGNQAEVAAGKVDGLKGSTDEAGDALEDAGKRGATMGDFYGAVISSARVAVAKLSDAARALFNQKTGLGDMAFEAKSATESLTEVSAELAEVNRRLLLTGAGDWLNRWVREVKVASLETQKAFLVQAASVENMQRAVESGTYSMAELNRLSKSAASSFSLLGDQQLSGLNSAIDSARSKMDGLNSSAESTLNSLSQRLAEIQGDTEEAQRLQYEAEKKRLVQMQRQAQQEGADNAAADYGKALDQLKQINSIEQKNRTEAENAREKEAADRAAQQAQAERERQASERERNTVTKTQSARVENVKTVNVNLGGQSFRVLAQDEQSFIRALESARRTSQ